ncbi:UNVERIFIED_CONTAM: hypothetical protein FKN15_060873 [Acipenser sinensis]
MDRKGLNPHRPGMPARHCPGKLQALPPAAEEWQECATPLSALLLTALQPVDPFKPLFLAQDYYRDFWAFKGEEEEGRLDGNWETYLGALEAENLCAACRERGHYVVSCPALLEEQEREHHAWAEGVTTTSTFLWLEEDCLPLLSSPSLKGSLLLPSPPPEGDYLQLPPPPPEELELPLTLKMNTSGTIISPNCCLYCSGLYYDILHGVE